MRDAWPSFVEVRRFLCCVFGLIVYIWGIIELKTVDTN